ncbi:MAG: hypothetical protein E7643_06250 [Ruminococcaceae bacterium]|nr:hypothetical protein [Oscillospiraceae bacterium]
MKLYIKANGNTLHEQLLMRRLKERIPVTLSEAGYRIDLRIDAAIGKEESYQILSDTDGCSVVGSCSLGLFFGIGKLLHSAKWTNEEMIPTPTNGTVTPATPFRAMYFSVHFYNWYHMASVAELESYVEDMLLWGYNAILSILPVANITYWGDDLHRESAEKISRIYTLAKKYGMRVGILSCVNQTTRSRPAELINDTSFNLLMRGNHGQNICMSKPGALEHMQEVWSHVLDLFEGIGLDYIVSWPYDEGGCGCAECRPWGANKYLDTVIELRKVVLARFPHAKFVVSTWAFDDPDDEGEYEGLYRRLKTDLDWVDYLMIDSHGEFPRYALEHEVIKPIINFPEISMWGLIPWGGFGANPLPTRFQEFWDSSKHLLSGGLPYSEGVYEDISKIQCIGYYWNPDASWQEILSEYIRFEYSPEVVEDVLEMMLCIERNHTHIGNGEEPELGIALRAAELARAADSRLDQRARNAWRWRILYIRAILDEKRYIAYQTAYPNDPKHVKRFSLFSGDLLINDREAQEMFAELQALYHSLPANGLNHFTLPPLGGTAHKEDI